MSTEMSMTFTKLFSSITESTIWCEDSDTRVVWITFLAMADRHGRVWGSIPGIANRARVSTEVAEAAIQKFLNPDPYSRSNTYDPKSEGRRIEVIEGGWKIINHSYYREIRDEEERRAYKAAHERERRARIRGQRGQKCTAVDSIGHNAEADTEAEAGKSNAYARTSSKLPSLGEVQAYCAERTNSVDPQKWFDYYSSNGWKVGRNPMKDWRAAVRTWEKNGFSSADKTDKMTAFLKKHGAYDDSKATNG